MQICDGNPRFACHGEILVICVVKNFHRASASVVALRAVGESGIVQPASMLSIITLFY